MSDEKFKRPGSMGDEERAAPRVPATVEVDAVDPCSPLVVEEDPTPPPIVVDDIGRPLTRARNPSPFPPTVRRERRTIQEVAEELWPARKALDLNLQLLQRVVAVETKVEDLEKNGPAAIAAAGLAGLRAELIGADGKGGVVGMLAGSVDRDLDDHRKHVGDVEARATKADRFVRRVIQAAIGSILGAAAAAVMIIYHSGARSEEVKADAAAAQAELIHKIELLDQSLTELQDQVKLLLESRMGRNQ